MRNILTTIFALAVALMSPLAFASDLTGIQNGTYLLHMNGDPGCSAQAIKRDGKVLFLTANHCVTDTAAEYSVNRITFDADKFDKKVFESVYYVDVVKRDATTDTAVLRPVDKSLVLDVVDLATIAEAKAALSKGAPVLVAGYPNSMASPIGDLVFTEGMYTGLSKAFVASVTSPMFRTTASIYYGNSGGGLYVKIGDTWKLIGIASQTDPELRWVNSLFATTESIDKAIRLLAPLRPATDK